MLAMVTVEAIRTAQAKYGKKPVTAEEVRWGLENLNIDAAQISFVPQLQLRGQIVLESVERRSGFIRSFA